MKKLVSMVLCLALGLAIGCGGQTKAPPAKQPAAPAAGGSEQKPADEKPADEKPADEKPAAPGESQ